MQDDIKWCSFVHEGNRFVCLEYGANYDDSITGKVWCQCGRFNKQRPAKPLQHNNDLTKSKPGTHLHNLIKKYLQEDYKEGCGCESMVQRMNTWGPDGFRENLEIIVNKMVKEASGRGWKNAFKASVPLASRDHIRAMVMVAIHLSEHGEEECRKPERIDVILEEVVSVSSVAVKDVATVNYRSPHPSRLWENITNQIPFSIRQSMPCHPSPPCSCMTHSTSVSSNYQNKKTPIINF